MAQAPVGRAGHTRPMRSSRPRHPSTIACSSRFALLVVLVLGVLGAACSSGDGEADGGAGAASTTARAAPAATVATEGESADGVWQVGTISALSAGGFGGLVPVGALPDHGDVGVGTFDDLDGEMVVLDGVVWRVPIDGIPVEADPAATTPFAQVTSFDVDESIAITAPLDCDGIQAVVDERLGADVPLAALRVRGRFGILETRSVPAQAAPFPTLDAIVPAQQVTFDHTDVAAVMVGFRTGDTLESVSPPGFHFHALTDDRRGGGHVLHCDQVTDGVVEVDVVSDLDLSFDGQGSFDGRPDGSGGGDG